MALRGVQFCDLFIGIDTIGALSLDSQPEYL